MKKYLKTVLSLTIICAVVALLLSVTNQITAPLIQKQEDLATQKALKEVLPDGEDFKAIDITKYKFPSTVTEVYSEKNGGYVFKIETSGYADGFIIMCGIDKDGKVAGNTYTASGETHLKDKKAVKNYGENFKGKTLENVDKVDTISGSTLTTTAWKGAISDALKSFAILGGAEIDTRSEPEILADTLPEAKEKFTVYYMSNDFTAWKADNNTGYVYYIDGKYVGCDNDGNLKTEEDKDTQQKVKELYKNTAFDNLTRINLEKYKNIPFNIEYAYKTPDGNYMFDIKAAGFGINGSGPHATPSGEYIKIRIFLSKDGSIISCVTTYQSETKGYGAFCGEKDYYSQYIGKNAENYSEVDNIANATYTYIGYEEAVGTVFTALDILKGGAK